MLSRAPRLIAVPAFIQVERSEKQRWPSVKYGPSSSIDGASMKEVT